MNDTQRANWSLMALVGALAALILAAAAFAKASSDGTTAQAGRPSGQPPESVSVTLGELFIKPNMVDLPAGRGLIVVSNSGAIQHNLAVDGTALKTPLLDPHAVTSLDVSALRAGTYKLLCDVPGHAAGGMVGTLRLDGESTGSAASTPAAPAGSGAAAPSVDATIDFNATPPAGWRAFDANLEPGPGGKEHVLTLEASETVLEVAPGVTQEMWTFNNQVPAPILRGRVGDVFTVTLVNKGKLGHSIDFHASKVAWNDEMRTILPGQSLAYQFEAKHAGIFMYHCGTAPALHHIGNGMFGALIVDPPDLGRADHEFVLVQSEIYAGPPGQPGDLAKMQDDAWDAVVFNGYVNQYKYQPLRVEPGQRVRVWVLDAGPSENSSFHIVGTIFDTVYKEGNYLLRPGPGNGGSQAIDLQPAQGGFVEFTFDEAGLYLIVTHKFSNVGKGALGIFQAGELTGTAAGASH